jgi:hypothetical protein
MFQVFRALFQVFHLDVAKVYLECCICCKLMFQVFYMFQTYVSCVSIWMLHILLWLYPHVLSVCFKCFILMLKLFQLDVAKVDLDVEYVAMPIHACFKCFIYFRRILQMFHLYVWKVDWNVARRGRWLADSSLPQPPVTAARVQSCVNPREFPRAGTG